MREVYGWPNAGSQGVLQGGLQGSDLSGDSRALCDSMRQVVQAIAEMSALLRDLLSARTERRIFAEAGGDMGIGLLTQYLKLSLATCPATHDLVSVATSVTPLIRNEGVDPVAFMITNEDVAKWIRLGTETLTLTTGIFLDALDHYRIFVPGQTTVFGITDTGTTNVDVARLVIPRFSEG